MVELLPPAIEMRPHAGGWRLRSTTPLPAGARCVGEWLIRWARERADDVLLAERGADGGWVRLSYGEVLAAVEGIGSGLLALGASPDRPVAILSENSIASALLALAAMHIGVPVSPISAAYSLQSRSFARLRDVIDQLDPGLVFAEDPKRYGEALAICGDRIVLSARGAERSIEALARTPVDPALRRAFASVGPDTIAKVLFTSGSTGRPKGVVNTQRMLTCNQESLAACWPFVASTPPVIVDWLPWSHTFGGNHNFFFVLRNGGSLYIDGGRPVPGMVETTLKNLAEISPTIWFNVPRGFDQAVALLERDRDLAAAVFARLDVVFYAAAALSPATRARLEAVAAQVGRAGVFFTSAWGSTETAPLSTSCHFPTPTTGNLGVPVPAVELAMVPVDGRFELRVRGPNVTPGTWRAGGGIEPCSLDEHGFLPTGDAGRLVDEARPDAGIAFVGRLSENFKLSSGTWVNVAGVRAALVDACAPLVLDAVIAGHDREHLGALLVPSPVARQLSPVELASRLLMAIAAHDQAHPGGSERIARALVLDDPLSLDEGETTDKGYTNQRRVLQRRAAEVDRLFADVPDDGVLVFAPGDATNSIR